MYFRSHILPLLLCTLSVSSLAGQSNEGTSFWLGFMQIFRGTENEKVVMITSKTNTTGTIQVPLQNWSQSFTVQANDVTLITMPEFTQTVGSEFINDNGIYVTSNDPVSVYMHQYFTFRAEASVVLPEDALGREHYTMSFEGGTWEGEAYPSEFLIVGTQENTLVEITLTQNSRQGRPNGSTFSVTLDRGETYQVRAEGQSDLTGSRVTSDKPIAVFSGNAWTQIPSQCGFRDNLIEQMYPVSTLGSEFVTIPNRDVVYDIYRILATEDNTEIEVLSGSSSMYTLDAGEYRQFSNNEPAYIRADKPIMVAQYMIGATCNGVGIGDPAMVLLNSIEQTRDTVTLYNSRLQNIQRNFINIITRTADAPTVVLDGTNLQQSGQVFTEIGFGSGFSFIQVEVNAGAHTIFSEGCGVIATAYGYGEFESYAYSGGASFRDINENPLPEGGCLNDTVFFKLDLPEERYTVTWDIGVIAPVQDFSFWHVFDQLGTFPATAIIYDECLMKADTFRRDLRISLRQALQAPDPVNACVGDQIQLSVEDLAGALYEWKGPNGFFSEDRIVDIIDADTSDSGLYEAVGVISGCATFPAFTNVEVNVLPEPNLGNDTIFCSDDGILFILEPGIFDAYLWQDGSEMSFYEVQEEGVYSVTVTNEFGCTETDEMIVLEQCPTKIFMPNVFTPNGDGRNDVFGVLGSDLVTVHLRIFDRWGSLMFETTNLEEGWNGTSRGKELPTGIYTWMLAFTGYGENGQEISEVRSGDVLLIR